MLSRQGSKRAYLSKHDDVKADAICLGECALLIASKVPVVLGKPGGKEGRLGISADPGSQAETTIAGPGSLGTAGLG